MSSIMLDEKPGKTVVETGWLEQLADDAQTLHQMLEALEISTQDSNFGKFIGAIRERMGDLASQLGQMMEE